MIRSKTFNFFILLAVIGYCFFANAQAVPDTDPGLKNILSTRVYTASRKEEDPENSPSAIYVITADDLKQMNVRHVADALRTVPGLEVAKISSDIWMVSSRGFGEQFSNKLLVLVDGRPVYTTLFSGVLWNAEDIPIIDIKQIEVVRGPGATLWGANAVNGVINIITLSSRDTVGRHVNTTLGVAANGQFETVVEAQDNNAIKDFGTIRTTIKAREEPSDHSTKNPNYDDSWEDGSASFRFDSPRSYENSLSVQGSAYSTSTVQPRTFPTLVAPFTENEQGTATNRGAYLQSSYTKSYGHDEQLTLTNSLDYSDWKYADTDLTLVDGDAEAQYDWRMFDAWDTIAGAQYRFSADDLQSSDQIIYDPRSRYASFLNGFFQTKIPLSNQLAMTTGTKVETSTYNDLDFSPSLKFSWQPDAFVSTWASYSRAYRAPSRGSYDISIVTLGTPVGYAGLVSSKSFKPERVDAYETGLRLNVIKGLHFDTSVYFNQYADLRTLEQGLPSGPITLAEDIGNEGRAQTRGVEFAATYQTSPDFKLNASFAHEDMQFTFAPGTTDAVFQDSARLNPVDTFSLRGSYTLCENWTLNSSAYYSDAIPAIKIPSYTKVDANIAWVALENVEVIFGVDNLTDNYHPEYSAPLFGQANEVPRIVYVTTKIDF